MSKPNFKWSGTYNLLAIKTVLSDFKVDNLTLGEVQSMIGFLLSVQEQLWRGENLILGEYHWELTEPLVRLFMRVLEEPGVIAIGEHATRTAKIKTGCEDVYADMEKWLEIGGSNGR